MGGADATPPRRLASQPVSSTAPVCWPQLIRTRAGWVKDMCTRRSSVTCSVSRCWRPALAAASIDAGLVTPSGPFTVPVSSCAAEGVITLRPKRRKWQRRLRQC